MVAESVVSRYIPQLSSDSSRGIVAFLSASSLRRLIFQRIWPPGDLSACNAQAGACPSLGRPQLCFGREGFPRVQNLENQSAYVKPLREMPPPDRLRNFSSLGFPGLGS